MEQARPEAGPDSAAAAQPAKAGRDRVAKLVFVVLTVAIVALVYWTQRRGLNLRWDEDLEAALLRAAEQKRPVLAFFISSPPGDTARRLSKNTIPKNAEAIKQGNFITVLVPIRSMTSKVAKRYSITSLPTMLVIGPDGVEQNRREGFIGELEFRRGFLDRSEIIPPPTSSPAR